MLSKFFELSTAREPQLPRAYHNYWVYILTNKPRGTLYIGVTGGIDDRMERHIEGLGSTFTAKYKLKLLVYYEEFQYINDATAREKQLKIGIGNGRLTSLKRKTQIGRIFGNLLK